MPTNRKKKIAYVTGTRADFGLMMSVLKAIKDSSKLSLQLYATGMHLLPEYGNSVKLVKRQFPQVIIINADFSNDDKTAQAIFSAFFLEKVVSLFIRNKPDFVLILGDRPEMLATALACLYLRIPIGHIHGGEKTMTVDEVARHAITKLSDIHFVATRKAAERVRRLGEENWRVKLVGAPAIDIIKSQKLPTRNELFRQLKIKENNEFILVTQHPVSEEVEDAGRQMKEIITAVEPFDLPVVVIYPNADPGSKLIIKEIEAKRKDHNFYIFKNLEYKQFLALEREASVWVGNSSAGLIESASFQTPVVNVGGRQRGREQNANVQNVDYNIEQIRTAIKKALSNGNYKSKLKRVVNIFGSGTSGKRIVKILEELKIDEKLINKQIIY